MIITLIRLALNVPTNDANTEQTPPIGLAYLASICKKNVLHSTTLVLSSKTHVLT